MIAPGADVFTLFAGVNLAAVDDDGARGSDAQADLLTLDLEHRDGDVGADLKGFCRTAGEDQHTLHS
jgi:hypothetical protein